MKLAERLRAEGEAQDMHDEWSLSLQREYIKIARLLVHMIRIHRLYARNYSCCLFVWLEEIVDALLTASLTNLRSRVAESADVDFICSKVA